MSKRPIKFGTDGWRAGIADGYTFESVRYCAQGTADYLHASGLAARGMIVGYDMRFLSEEFAQAVAEVLAGNGIPVFLADHAAPTPVLSYNILPRRAAGGIWITASHNPPTDSGYKLRSDYGGAAAPETLELVERRIAAAQESDRVEYTDFDAGVRQGLIQLFDPDGPYEEQLARLIDVNPIKQAGLRIVADPMWGVGQGWFTRLLGGGATVIKEIHGERNPLFPGMVRPEPIASNLVGLLEAIEPFGADAGLANDGDADRVGFADEHGQFVNQLQVYALLAYYMLGVRGLRGPLVRSISSTVMANKLAAHYDVPVYETGVGFKYVAPKMIETNALIGGEESGGFAFANHIPERDGILAGLYLLDLMVRTGKRPSQLIETLFDLVGPHYYDRVDREMPPERKAEVVERVAAAEPTHIAGLKVVEIDRSDGFRYVLEDGQWALIRFSGTEPVIRVYCEVTAEQRVSAVLAEGLAIAGLEA
ncbi:MAG: phosphoglucomutase/phosphomannomutase family protein [Chloroflexi bacterium]|nr:phosphoglucomutase/phosphomannomutase family protein [Chloroflexota bacterium]